MTSDTKLNNGISVIKVIEFLGNKFVRYEDYQKLEKKHKEVHLTCHECKKKICDVFISEKEYPKAVETTIYCGECGKKLWDLNMKNNQIIIQKIGKCLVNFDMYAIEEQLKKILGNTKAYLGKMIE